MATINLNKIRNLLHKSTEFIKDHEVERAVVFMHGNTVETIISEVDTPVQVQGAFEYAVNDGFSQGSNLIGYSGKNMTAKVIAVFSVDSSNNQDLAFYVSLNGSVVGDSEGFVTTGSGGKAVNVICQTVIDLTEGDEISVMIENYTSTHNVTVDNLSINIISIH